MGNAGDFQQNAKGLTSNNWNADLYVQDYFKPGSDKAGKNKAVKNAIDSSSVFPYDMKYTNTWMINFFSGYTGTIAYNKNYMENAKNVNPEMYKYITSKDKVVGPLGLCMMDWVGQRAWSDSGKNYVVFGDLLPQAIIDNNYKCRMNRKGE